MEENLYSIKDIAKILNVTIPDIHYHLKKRSINVREMVCNGTRKFFLDLAGLVKVSSFVKKGKGGGV